MTSKEVRKQFLDYFRSNGHEIVPSAPIVVKNDPTLMFTNAGMNQFKDIFLGNRRPEYARVANTQKCLRVSGKHNDLEEVGYDTYHHTMFEMLGNWSFGDYFKKEAIQMAWEFLTKRMEIDPGRLYATVFGGDTSEGLHRDDESATFWAEKLPVSHILDGTKRDNFWEMGNTGPCGPCTEIHIDIRDDRERDNVPGEELVNKDQPEVIEIWNLVFIQYNRKENGELVPLPVNHVDTGMGFERLCMIKQGKKSNYDTDIFMPIIREIGAVSGLNYGENEHLDIAMRVVADHLRAVAFSIADGQLPSNNKAGYVIRRILRRAVRYGYTYLKQNEPFIYRLVPVLGQVMGHAYPEIMQQEELITRVIREEERTFLRTLETGINRLETVISRSKEKKERTLDGKIAFELYDTFGFPLDLTALIARENNMDVDTAGFDREMQKQKNRSRNAAAQDASDWVELRQDNEVTFIGYDQLETEVRIVKYRKVNQKKKEYYHLVFDITPFYAESGGQVGDTGFLENGGEKIRILNTIRENELIIHIAVRLPENPEAVFTAVVDREKRQSTANNHTATHLLHWALRKVLGTHVEQKGSLVHPDYLRFDFSHFRKVTEEEQVKVASLVNEKIRENIPLKELRDIPLEEARAMGAMSLFGEKYGEKVRVIRFGESVELCGGTHVESTGRIGLFLIVSESAVAAGIRRIEAVTGRKAEELVYERSRLLEELKSLLKVNKDIPARVKELLEENKKAAADLEECNRERLVQVKNKLLAAGETMGDVHLVHGIVELPSSKMMRDLAFRMKNEVPGLVMVAGAVFDGKPILAVMIADEIVREKELDAREIIQIVASEIHGGGGGQPFYATAGGKNPQGLEKAINTAINLIKVKLGKETTP